MKCISIVIIKFICNLGFILKCLIINISIFLFILFKLLKNTKYRYIYYQINIYITIIVLIKLYKCSISNYSTIHYTILLLKYVFYEIIKTSHMYI